MKISVVTPTIRPEGLEVMKKCLEEQTMQDFEWLVEVGLTNRGHDLNQAFNKMIRRAKGELIVFYEDFTKIKSDGLERFWKAYQEHPDTLFTAPLGKVDTWADAPRWDWRAWTNGPVEGDYTDCRWQTCELDWGAIPKAILYDIGGFDEELDKHWSCDNVNVGKRADLAGYKFKCLFTNPAVAIDHDKIMAHPFRDKFKPAFNNERMMLFEAGLKIDYLKEPNVV
jgi:hypothetical protein